MDVLSLPLNAGRVDIWLCPFDTGDEALRQRCLPWLDDAELSQCAKFALEPPRQQYLVSRALVRQVLSRYLGRAPGSLRFTRDAHERPWLASPDDASKLCFSLSHTDGLVALAVSTNPLVGLDVENRHRPLKFQGIARSCFAPSEWAGLASLESEAQQRAHFFDLWTCKEAYIKARGKGLSIPLDQFAVEVQPSSARLTQAEDHVHALADWHFLRSQPTPGHTLALAALIHPPARLDGRTHWFAMT